METDRRTGPVAVPGDHPRDQLPEYVRGMADEPEAVRAHLTACGECQREVELLRALGEPAPALQGRERERAWARVRTVPTAPVRTGTSWLSAAWKVAAAIALLVTGLAVWQLHRLPTAGGEWNPTAAIQGWEEDLAALQPAPEDVRLALGWEVDFSGLPWQELEAADPSSLRAPWEERRP